MEARYMVSTRAQLICYLLREVSPACVIYRGSLFAPSLPSSYLLHRTQGWSSFSEPGCGSPHAEDRSLGGYEALHISFPMAAPLSPIAAPTIPLDFSEPCFCLQTLTPFTMLGDACFSVLCMVSAPQEQQGCLCVLLIDVPAAWVSASHIIGAQEQGMNNSYHYLKWPCLCFHV